MAIHAFAFRNGSHFIQLLKGRNINIEGPIESIRNLQDDIMNYTESIIPASWHTNDIDKIKLHIASVKTNIHLFADEILRILR